MSGPIVGALSLVATTGTFPVPLVLQSFEPPLTNSSISPDYWGATMTPMSEGDPMSAGASEAWALGGGGSSGAFSGSANFDGVQAMGLTITGELGAVTNRNVFLRLTFPGLIPAMPVRVTLYAGVGFHTESAPAACPIGFRIGATGTPVTTTVLGSWVLLTGTGTVPGDGTLVIDMGAFGIVGTDGYPLQRVCAFDRLAIWNNG